MVIDKDFKRKKLGIEGAVKIPNSDIFIVPGSLWNQWKTIENGEPEVDETEFEMLVDSKGKLILDESNSPQEVPRRRSIKNPKDVEYYKENDIKIYPSFVDLDAIKAESGSLYVGKDGLLYDPSGDTWAENEVHKACRELGGIFVNDTYIHLFQKRQGFLFLDGSYGSGKTTFAITHLLIICLTSKENQFNCFYGRQEKTMAEQLHKNIIEEIKRNNWEQHFKYSEENNGSKNILCLKNGGKFQLFGCDNDQTIKGWNNPTHILVDEVNQISFKSFGMLQSRLRRPGVKTLFIGCFNACDVTPLDSDDEGSWLWRYFFKEEGSGSKEDRIKRKAFKSIGVKVHHSDYLDNYCQNNYKYWLNLLIQAGFDMELANRFANGDWGIKLNAQQYYNRFNKEKHVRPTLAYHPGLSIINGWDENTQPYQPSLIVQRHGNEFWFIKEFLGYNPNNNVRGVAEMIIQEYGGDWDIKGESGRGLDHRAGWLINGDATSKKEDSKLEKGQNYFTILQDLLKQFKPEVRVQDANPNNKKRGEFLNLIFYQEIFGIKILISEEGCPMLIKDLENCMQDIKNEKKSGHKDKSTKIVNGVRQVQPYGHLCDTMDYIICENCFNEFLTFENGEMTIDAIGGSRSVRNDYTNKKYERDRNGRPIIEESHNIKWNKKSRGDTKYGEVEDNLITEEPEEPEEEINIVKKKSKNSW